MTKLIYADDSLPGITRRGAGTGFAYYYPDGQLIGDRAEKRRLNAIALPPAYVDAWFCVKPNGHLLATGYDARGRKQYRYHPHFRRMQESEKFDRALEFGKLLSKLRERVEADLSERGMSQRQSVAAIVRLLDLGALRIGSEGYTRENGSFGATTLRARHAELEGDNLRLRYKGKGGKQRDIDLSDRALARMVRRMQDLPGQHLFQYRDEDGETRAIGSADVNEYLREVMGEDFSAKNFRTWHASAMALDCLVQAEERMTIGDLLDCVATKLGNTPAVTRKSYIHPAIIDLVERQDEWREKLALPRVTKYQTRIERALLKFLEDAPTAAQLIAS